MLERYFTARMTLRRLRFGPSGPYVDRFAAVLERDGYAKVIARRYLRAAVHLGHSNLETTEIYTRGDPTEKLEAIEAIVPLHLRKGSFRPPDRLIALLKARP